VERSGRSRGRGRGLVSIDTRNETRTIADVSYSLQIRGNTVVSIFPGRENMPLYKRERFLQDKVPMVKVDRFVSDQDITS
jgi:hypothetical protein